MGGGGHVGNDGTITAYQCAGDAVTKQHRFVDLVGAVKADTNKPVSLCGGPHSLVVVGDAVVDVGGLGRTGLIKPHAIPGNVAHRGQIGQSEIGQIPPLIVGHKGQSLLAGYQPHLGGDLLIGLPSARYGDRHHGCAGLLGYDAHAALCAHVVATGHPQSDLIHACVLYRERIVKPIAVIHIAHVVGFVDNTGTLFPLGGRDGDGGVCTDGVASGVLQRRHLQIVQIPGVFLIVDHHMVITGLQFHCSTGQNIVLPVLCGGEGHIIGGSVHLQTVGASVLNGGYSGAKTIQPGLCGIHSEFHTVTRIKVADISACTGRRALQDLGALLIDICFRFVTMGVLFRNVAFRPCEYQTVQVPSGSRIGHRQGVIPFFQCHKGPGIGVCLPISGVGNGELCHGGVVEQDLGGSAILDGAGAHQYLIIPGFGHMNGEGRLASLIKVSHISGARVAGAIGKDFTAGQLSLFCL